MKRQKINAKILTTIQPSNNKMSFLIRVPIPMTHDNVSKSDDFLTLSCQPTVSTTTNQHARSNITQEKFYLIFSALLLI